MWTTWLRGYLDILLEFQCFSHPAYLCEEELQASASSTLSCSILCDLYDNRSWGKGRRVAYVRLRKRLRGGGIGTGQEDTGPLWMCVSYNRLGLWIGVVAID